MKCLKSQVIRKKEKKEKVVECATKINNKDYCKEHIKELKKELERINNEQGN